MKKVVRIGIILFILVLMSIAATGGYYIYMGIAANRESKAYVDNMIPQIAKAWSIIQYEQYISPLIREDIEWDSVDKLFNTYRNALGDLVRYGGASGQARVLMENNQLKTTATYAGEIWCKKGKARFRVELTKLSEEWGTTKFDVIIEGFDKPK